MIKAGVPDGELSVIRHTAENSEDFFWIHSREFRYRGVMYDVVRSEQVSDGATLLHCVTDHQETLLFANLDRMTKSRAARHPAHTKAIHFYSLLMGGLFTPPDSDYLMPDSGFRIMDAVFYYFISNRAFLLMRRLRNQCNRFSPSTGVFQKQFMFLMHRIYC